MIDSLRGIGRKGWWVALVLLASTSAPAQLKIDITSGVTDPIPIAVLPFDADPRPSSEVVAVDLTRSGRFSAGAANRSDYLVTGRHAVTTDGRHQIDYELTNLLTGQKLLRERMVASPQAWRNAAHRIADKIYERIIGARSSFATRIAYISVDGRPPAQRYQLIVADADGENSRVILESKQPLMSPAWSPDGEWLAYVSFETRSAAIYVQRLRTAERRRVSGRAGVNNAPAWSPDGKRLALTLSSPAGNLDVYVLELDGGALTRVTEHPSIDTEPVWSNDGSRLYFTSDRGGGPQVYRTEPRAGATATRVTFGGNYNARPRLSPDGKQLAFITRDSGGYRVAVQDLGNGSMSVLSKGSQDESPGYSPDGGTLIYAARERGQGVLATVSADGLISQRLKADRGDVRDPAWGPFLP